MSENAYDAVVIGSGLGGLTAAALLAKAGRKVCVIERNHSVGGAASAFKKGALTIEPALHQTADPHDPSEPKHAILKELGLLDEIEWIPVSPFYSVKGGLVGEMFDLPVGFDAAHHALSRRFPKSRDGFARLLGRWSRSIPASRTSTKAGEERSLRKLLRGGHRAAAARARLARLDRRHSPALPRRRRGGEIRDRGRHRLLRRRSASPGLAVLRHGAGRVSQGGRRVHQGRLARPVDEARQGRDQGGRIGAARPRGERDRLRRLAAVPPSCATSTRGPGRTSSASARSRSSPIARRTCSRTCCRPPNESAIERAYLGQPLSTSLFSAHFGLSVPPAKLGLDRYGVSVLPDWMKSLNQISEGARLFSADPGGRLPSYGIANYGAIDSGARRRRADSGHGRRRRSLRQLGGAFAAGRKGPARALARRLPGGARPRLSRIQRGGRRAHVPQRPLDAQFHEHARRRGLRLCAVAVRARDLGGRSALAQDAGSRRLPRFVLRGDRAASPAR